MPCFSYAGATDERLTTVALNDLCGGVRPYSAVIDRGPQWQYSRAGWMNVSRRWPGPQEALRCPRWPPPLYPAGVGGAPNRHRNAALSADTLNKPRRRRRVAGGRP